MEPAELTWRGNRLYQAWGGRKVPPLLDEPTLVALLRALREAEGHKAPAVLICGGARGTFAAGADLRKLGGLDPISAHAFSRRGQRMLDAIEEVPGVVIAAVQGRCIGGAFDLVLACDLRVCDLTATFEHPSPTLGFITGYGGTSRLPMLAGPASGGVIWGS